MTTLIDLSKLPPPDAIRPIDYEALVAAALAYLKELLAAAGIDFDLTALETEPLVVLEQARGYREMLLLQRINEAIRAVLLASARGGDLDQVAADFGLLRRTGETDASLRRRRQRAPHSLAAGTAPAYEFAATQADETIREAKAVRTGPGRVTVALLSVTGNGHVADAKVSAIAAQMGPLSEANPRLLTDELYVRSATIVEVPVIVRLFLPDNGPDPATVAARAKAAVLAMIEAERGIGVPLRVNALGGAAYSAGGSRDFAVIAPVADVGPGELGAVFVPSVTIRTADA